MAPMLRPVPLEPHFDGLAIRSRALEERELCWLLGGSRLAASGAAVVLRLLLVPLHRDLRDRDHSPVLPARLHRVGDLRAVLG
eukprot:6140023-Pyramimonas_sp.AAC.1